MNRYFIRAREDDGYDVIVVLDKYEVEFGLDFFKKENDTEEYDRFISYVKEKNKQVKIKTIRIFVSGLLVASIPLQLFLQAQAASVHDFTSLIARTSASPYAISEQQKFNMTYVYGGTVDQQIEQIKKADSFQTVSPSYFDIDSQGKLVLNSVSQKFIETMHQMQIKVVPMLSNHWDRAAGRLALKDPAGLARQIAGYVEQYDLDGVNVDIENVTHTERDAYTLLVKTLREELPKEKEVSVAVAANPNGWNIGWHGSYDYESLAKYADYLMIMAYDEHWQGSDPGPVAGLPFVQRSVEYALKYAPAEKIVLGVPFYGRIWSEDGNFNGNGIGIKNLEKMLKDYNAKITYSEEQKSPKAEFTVKAGDKEYTVNGKKLKPGKYTVWFENERSLEEKTRLIHQYDLKGLGSWALYQATDSVLEQLSSWLTPEQEGEVRYGTVTADSLRVRQKPTTESETIAYYLKGDRVRVVGEENGWYKVKLPSGTYGYVSKNYVRLDGEKPPVTERTGYTSGTNVRVRSKASTTASILTTLKKGASFTVLGEKQNGWYNVRLSDGKVGYIHGDYVTFTKPVTERTGYTSGSNVRVRSKASTTASILTTLKKGVSFTVLGEKQNDWYNVRLSDGKVGYIHGDYVTFRK